MKFLFCIYLLLLEKFGNDLKMYFHCEKDNNNNSRLMTYFVSTVTFIPQTLHYFKYVNNAKNFRKIIKIRCIFILIYHIDRNFNKNLILK